MTRYDRLYELYAEFDTETLRAYREFVDLFPPLDSRVALDRWDEANAELFQRRARIERTFMLETDTDRDDNVDRDADRNSNVDRDRDADRDGNADRDSNVDRDGDTDRADSEIGGAALAEVASMADREAAFTALDLHGKYGRAPNALVLDVDETLRSAGDTDNEIPRETLHLLTEFAERDVPLVICTGQTLENVKGFLIQGLGNELVHSGDVSVVYEAGAGVFTPGNGADTKRLLYEGLDDDVRGVVDDVRGSVLREAPEGVRRGCHLQGNEFNVTLKPNYETGSDDAEAVIDDAMVHLLGLVGEAVAARVDGLENGPAAARAFYGDADPEIAAAVRRAGAGVPESVPAAAVPLFERIEVALYRADAAELAAGDLHKAAGVEASLDVLGIAEPFVCVMGDSKSDLRVMEWAADRDAGVAAAPEHASERVLEHVRASDDLVFAPGDAAGVLRTVYAWRCLAGANGDARGE
ncbi:HAD family hydrolase [Halobaculum sp. CBA1158]|uniref:HAD family hydrolase n=1 Tax=Halobaculum sp. CBA1158 TaxID=2904243 RepID=UPI001F2010CA|nr:HAD family hydrolase [Halobaculum sp. CBA1158]UIO99185.1 HAD family hydrolase [Halobaculum sp. CBA1158]